MGKNNNQLRVTIPSGYPKWAGPDDEPTLQHWFNNNYPRPDGVSPLDWVRDHFLKTQSESDTEWLERLAEHPIWIHALTDWPNFRCKIVSPRFGGGACLLADIENNHAFQRHFNVLGEFLNKRLRSLIKMGWVPNYMREDGWKYVRTYRSRNAVHNLLRALNAQSVLSLRLPGEPFYHHNTVLPTHEARQTARANHDVHNAGVAGPWNIMVACQKWDLQPGLVAACSQLEQEPLRDGMTQRPGKPFKWQNYQVMLSGDCNSDGQIRMDGWESAEKLILKGAPKESTAADLVAYGFRQGYPRHFIKDGKWTVPCMGCQVDHEFIDFNSPRSEGHVVRYYCISVFKLNSPVSLLRKLQGFDESLVQPRR